MNSFNSVWLAGSGWWLNFKFSSSCKLIVPVNSNKQFFYCNYCYRWFLFRQKNYRSYSYILFYVAIDLVFNWYVTFDNVVLRSSCQIIWTALTSYMAVLIHQYLLVQLHVTDVVRSFIVVIRESQVTCRRRYFSLPRQHNWRKFSANAAICWKNLISPLTLLLRRWSFRRLQMKSRRKVPPFFW